MDTLGERVAKERNARGWSQAELAARVTRLGFKIGQSGIDKIEKRPNVRPGCLWEIAKALGVREEWLITGKGPKETADAPAPITVPAVGYVGAGSAVEFVDAYEKGGGLKDVLCPRGLDPRTTIAVIVRGDSQAPMITDGWLIFYSRDPEPDAAAVVGKLSVVKVDDGPVMLKRVRRAPRRNRYNLESVNAPVMEDVKLEWAAPVLAMLPPELAEEAA